MQTRYFATCPPNPVQSAERYRTAGQQLLGLVRSLEKKHDLNHDGVNSVDLLDNQFKALIQLLQFLIPLVARNGLLQGDAAAAEKRVEESSIVGVDHGFDSKNDRNRTMARSSGLRMGKSNAEYAQRLSAGDNQIISCIVRMLGGGGGGQQQSPNGIPQPLVGLELDDQRLLILLVSDLTTAASTFVLQGLTKVSTCVAAEYDVLASNAKSLLIGLTRSMDHVLASATGSLTATAVGCTEQTPDFFRIETSDSLAVFTLRACHRAAMSLVSLLGPRFSRLSAYMQRLSVVGVWQSFAVVDPTVLESATRLHATIQGIGAGGGTHSGTTGQHQSFSSTEGSWNKSLRESVALLFSLLESACPLNSRLEEIIQQLEFPTQQSVGKAAVDGWLQSIRKADSEEQGTTLFVHYVQVLVSMTTALLSVEGLAWNHVLNAQVDIVSILDLVELLICFPINAESLYFRTKKRLRRETTEMGLFSPLAVTNMANRVKIMGHELIDALLTSIGCPALLPFARRLLKTCFGSLLSSSSTALRSVLEDRALQSAPDVMQRWLNSSIAIRTAALQTAQRVVLVVGTEPSQRSTSLRIRKRVEDLDRLVTLVCGCLVEQLQWLARRKEKDEDWGSFQERIDNLVACSNCLDAFLVSGGPFLSNVARSLIDSTIECFLKKCLTMNGNRVKDLSPLCNCALSLGVHSCSTAWADGEASSLGLCLQETARRLLKISSVDSVLHKALSTIRICDALNAPRIPALQVITQKSIPPSSRNSIADVHVLEARLVLEEQRMMVSEPSGSQGSKRRKVAKDERMLQKESTVETTSSNLKVPDTAMAVENSKVGSGMNEQNLKDEEAAAIMTTALVESMVESSGGRIEESMVELVSGDSHGLVNETNDQSDPLMEDGGYNEMTKLHITDATGGHPRPYAPPTAQEEEEDGEDTIPMIFDAPPDEEDE